MNRDQDPFQDPKPYPVAKFLLLGSTLFLGASTQFAAAFVLGFAVFATMASVSVLLTVLEDSVPAEGRFPIALVLSTLLTTLYDFLLTTYAPHLRETLGVYLNLVALCPLVSALAPKSPSEKEQEATLGRVAADGLQFWLILSVLALLREAVGAGRLTLWPDSWVVVLPILSLAPMQTALASSGAFFLAAAGLVLFRWLHRRSTPIAWSRTDPDPKPVPQTIQSFLPSSEPKSERPVKPAVEETSTKVKPADEKESSMRPWGESLEAVIGHFMNESAEKRRFLVVGCGTGELVWYISFLALEGRKHHKVPDFRVRGTDPFLARIETAQAGIYRENQLDFIPIELKKAYLLRGRDEDRHQLRVGEEPRQLVEFETADFGNHLFFYKTADVIVLNQSLEGMTENRQKQVLSALTDDLIHDGALVLLTDVKRSLLSEALRRTGDKVFRKV